MAYPETLTRVLHIAFYGNQHSARFLLAVAETVWFIALIWPGDTFIRPTYAAMSSLGGEMFWAVAFGITAICQWTIFFTRHYYNRYAATFALWNMSLWWFVSVSMYLSVYPPPAAISGELALAFGASWIYVRSGCGAERRKGRGND